MRLAPGWLAGQPGGEWSFDGDESIRRRPVDRVAMPLRQMGAWIEAHRRAASPRSPCTACRCAGSSTRCRSPRAQVKSCVLIAGLLASGTTTVIEPEPSRDHTERLLARAGARITRDGDRIELTQHDELELGDIHVPGDPSSAAFHIAAAILVKGSRIVITDMSANWTRTGFVRIAERMGAVVIGDLEPPRPGRDPARRARLRARRRLRPARRHGRRAARGAAGDRRAAAGRAARLLRRGRDRRHAARRSCASRSPTGSRPSSTACAASAPTIEATDDGFVVTGNGGLRGGTIEAHGDHRLAMLGAVAGLACREGVEVVGMEAAAVSYPRFEPTSGSRFLKSRLKGSDPVETRCASRAALRART